MKTRNRRGMLIPLVLVALVALGILGLYITFSGTSEYNQTVSAAYRWRADAHNQAILEEVLALLYDRLNRPFDNDPSNDVDEGRQAPLWHSELFEAVKAAVDGGVTGKIPGQWSALDLSGLLPRSQEIMEAEDSQILECTASFEGFRKIVFTPEGKFVDSDDPYYTREELEKLPLDKPVHYQGFVTVRITTICGLAPKGPKVRRTLESTHDIKVLNEAPMARQFVAWQYQSTLSDPDSPASQLEEQKEDLNTGGGLKIYPEGSRILAVGPYEVDSHGWNDGTGAHHRTALCESYLPALGDPDSTTRWHGWSTIPSMRAGVVQASLFFGSPPPARPWKTFDWSIALFQDIFDTLTFGAWMAFGVDPGFAIIYNPLEYHCANRDLSLQDRSFSLVGSPMESIDHEDLSASTYSGLFFRCEGADLKEQGTQLLSAGEYPNVAPGDPKETLLVAPEVNIETRCKTIKYNHFEIPLIYTDYKLTETNSNVKVPYGLYYMQPLKEPTIATIGRFVLQLAMFASTVVVGGALHGAWGFGQTVQEILTGIIITGVTGGLLTLFKPDVGALPGGGGGDLPDNSFPSNYCAEPFRLVTRYYEDLNEIPTFQFPPEEGSGEAPQRTLHLDGNIFVRDMTNAGWFTYRGKGSLIVAPKEEDNEVVVNGPILKGTAHTIDGDMVTNVNDHLNLICATSDPSPEKLSAGREQLVINAGEGVNENEAALVEAAVLAPQGVRPNACNAWIHGNLTCGYFNKRKIPNEKKLRVIYDRSFTDYSLSANDAQWNNIAISFRPAAWRNVKGGN